MTEQGPRSEAELTELISSIDVQAPPELRERVQAMAERASARRSQPAGHPARVRLGVGVAALATLVLVLLLAVNASSPSKAGVNQAAALALAAPTMGAPGESRSSPAALAVSQDGVAFPYWAGRFHWRASGSRLDSRGGRTIRTVFYTDPAGRQVGYAIVSGPAPVLSAGTLHRRHGAVFHLTSLDGVPVLSWLRAGHLCVVSGRGVSPATLLALASWRERPAAS